MVYVVDDDSAVRDSLMLLLRTEGLLCTTYASAEDFLRDFRPGMPSCLIADVMMKGMSGLELQKNLRSRGYAIPTIVITGHGDISMAVHALKNGAADFIEKPCDDERVISAIQEAMARQEALSEDIPLDEIIHRRETLSPRESEVMDLLVEGQINKVIGTRLGISERTVEIHKSKMMQKMGAKGLAELVRMALRMEYRL
jgi:FixJ family two-component response regulator